MMAVGTVKSQFAESTDPFIMRRHQSSIFINEDLQEGLFRLEESRYIQVVFVFHQSEGYSLRTSVYHGGEKGVFASRSPHRPSSIGVSVVELLEIRGRELIVRGLDALDETPVLDINPYSQEWDDEGAAALFSGGISPKEELQSLYPRRSFIQRVNTRDTETLLRGAGTLHGHYCPGLSVGVIAAVEGLHALAEECGIRVADLMSSDGLEELLVLPECNNCSVDGIQYVTGCTLGNNGLIYRDIGKTAFTMAVRSGKGVRLFLKEDTVSLVSEAVPEFPELFDTVIRRSDRDAEMVRRYKRASREASFHLLNVPVWDLFSKEAVEVSLPDYAPMKASVTCGGCGESFMETKSVSCGDNLCCRACAGAEIPTVIGGGIVLENGPDAVGVKAPGGAR